MKQIFFFVPMLLLAAIFNAPNLLAQEETIIVSEGYVRGLPPGVSNTAAFMRITNNSDTDMVLIGADTPVAESVTIHATVNDNGMMKMEHQMTLVIPAKDEVVLESGGLHLMLMDLKKSLSDEDVQLSLKFSNGLTKSLILPVINILDE